MVFAQADKGQGMSGGRAGLYRTRGRNSRHDAKPTLLPALRVSHGRNGFLTPFWLHRAGRPLSSSHDTHVRDIALSPLGELDMSYTRAWFLSYLGGGVPNGSLMLWGDGLAQFHNYPPQCSPAIRNTQALVTRKQSRPLLGKPWSGRHLLCKRALQASSGVPRS